MSAPQPPRAGGDPLPASLRGLLLLLLAAAGLALLVIGYNRLTAGNADARVCLPVVLVLVALFASAPLAYTAFQEELTAAEMLRRLGQSRVAWIVTGALTGALVIASIVLAALSARAPTPPAATPLAQRQTPIATTATASSTETAAATAGPTRASATATTAPTATATHTPTPRPTSTRTAAPPTATPTSASPTDTPPPPPTETVTLVPPDPGTQIAQTMIETNDAIVAFIENPDTPRDTLRAYYCGDNAWRKMDAYLTRTAARTDRPRSASYAISDEQPAIQDIDERWRLEQVETWTYVGANGRTNTTREAYVYWLVATESRDPPFCIDDYTAQALNP